MLNTATRFLGLLAVFSSLFIPLTALSSDFEAMQITPANQSRVPAGGLDAIGGVGDWLLRNGRLCAVISSKDHQTYLALHGGALVDLWHCAWADDQWSTMHQQYNLEKTGIPPTEQIKARTDEQSASIRVVSARDGIRMITEYHLNQETPESLFVTTTLERLEKGDPIGMFGTTVLHPRGSLSAFTLDTVGHAYSRGFRQPYIDTSKTSDILASVVVADLQILVGSRHIQPSISYGLRQEEAVLIDADGHQENLKTFLIGGQTFTLFGLFTEPFFDFTRKPSLFSFLRSRFMDLKIGQELVIKQEILVGSRADAASITNRIYKGPWVSGVVDTSQAGITVRDQDGQSLTFVRPDPNGSFRFRLPEETTEISLKVVTPWSATEARAQIVGQEQRLGVLKTGGYATVALPQGKPMALIFKSLDGGEDPILMNELTGVMVDGEKELTGPENNRISLAGSSVDTRSVRLPSGRYRVIATRGIEYDLTETVLTIRGGDVVTLDLPAPTRVVRSENLISADFHVHSGVSFDSSLLPEQRIIDFVAQGCEVLVPTEHGISSDLRPIIEQLGLRHRVASFPGVELTSMVHSEAAPTSIGHSNVFPIEVDDTKFMGGTLPIENKRLGEVIGAYKERYPDSVFQLNHPRLNAYDSDIAFFNHLSQGKSYDPGKLLNEAPNRSLVQELPGTSYRDIDFDAMELLSGEAMDGYAAVKQDWLSLLKQGIYQVGTANSDSHSSHNIVALPRNYLMVEDDDPATISPEKIVGALKAGRVFGTTGPLLRVRLGDTLPGGTYHGTEGMLLIRADAAPWVDVSTLKVSVNGKLYLEIPVVKGEQISLEMSFAEDSFVTVEALGEVTPDYEIVAPGFSPFAFSNPIFVVVDSGDG